MIKKKHTLKTRLLKKPSQRTLWIAIAILAVLQAASLGYIIIASQHAADLSRTTSGMSKRFTSMLIADTEKNRYKDPVIDVTESRVYIPEARIYLPLTTVSRDVRYKYSEANNTKRLTLTTSKAIGYQTDKDSPSCDAVVNIEQTKYPRSTVEYDLVSTLQSADGQLRYVYQHTACSIYTASFSDDLAKLAQEIHYY